MRHSQSTGALRLPEKADLLLSSWRLGWSLFVNDSTKVCDDWAWALTVNGPRVFAGSVPSVDANL